MSNSTVSAEEKKKIDKIAKLAIKEIDVIRIHLARGVDAKNALKRLETAVLVADSDAGKEYLYKLLEKQGTHTDLYTCYEELVKNADLKKLAARCKKIEKDAGIT